MNQFDPPPTLSARLGSKAWHGVAFWTLLVSQVPACGSRVHDTGGTDTSTDWVRACRTDGDCRTDEHCGCEICTRRCVVDADCETLSENATCERAPDRCGNPQAICVPEPTFSWLTATPTEPTSTSPSECVAVYDTSQCCFPHSAVIRAELEANECLVEVGQSSGLPLDVGCDGQPLCPGASCAMRLTDEFIAKSTTSGGCELVPPCDDGTCIGSPCDPLQGCSDGLACTNTQCESLGLTCNASGCGGEGVCRPSYAADGCDGGDSVCGCDGQTYASVCEADMARVSIDYWGECSDAPVCTLAIQAGPGQCCGTLVAAPRHDLTTRYCLLDFENGDVSGALEALGDGCVGNLCPDFDCGNYFEQLSSAEARAERIDGLCTLTAPAPPPPDPCVAAVDQDRCCLGFVAVRASELGTISCVGNPADVENIDDFHSLAPAECPGSDCPGADCVPLSMRVPLGATEGDDGQCELIGAE